MLSFLAFFGFLRLWLQLNIFCKIVVQRNDPSHAEHGHDAPNPHTLELAHTEQAAPYLYATHRRGRAFWLSLSTCLPTLLGYGLGRLLWRGLPPFTMGMVTACIAGLMITISCEELIPAEAGGSDRLSAMPALMAGVILVLVLRQLLG